jgi:hypothetical protein
MGDRLVIRAHDYLHGEISGQCWQLNGYPRQAVQFAVNGPDDIAWDAGSRFDEVSAFSLAPVDAGCAPAASQIEDRE